MDSIVHFTHGSVQGRSEQLLIHHATCSPPRALIPKQVRIENPTKARSRLEPNPIMMLWQQKPCSALVNGALLPSVRNPPAVSCMCPPSPCQNTQGSNGQEEVVLRWERESRGRLEGMGINMHARFYSQFSSPWTCTSKIALRKPIVTVINQ